MESYGIATLVATVLVYFLLSREIGRLKAQIELSEAYSKDWDETLIAQLKVRDERFNQKFRDENSFTRELICANTTEIKKLRDQVVYKKKQSTPEEKHAFKARYARANAEKEHHGEES